MTDTPYNDGDQKDKESITVKVIEIKPEDMPGELRELFESLTDDLNQVPHPMRLWHGFANEYQIEKMGEKLKGLTTLSYWTGYVGAMMIMERLGRVGSKAVAETIFEEIRKIGGNKFLAAKKKMDNIVENVQDENC